jgi:hypothetical protein
LQCHAIEVNYRGAQTKQLLQWHREPHQSHETWNGISFGGYYISYLYKEVEKELRLREIPLEELK